MVPIRRAMIDGRGDEYCKLDGEHEEEHWMYMRCWGDDGMEGVWGRRENMTGIRRSQMGEREGGFAPFVSATAAFAASQAVAGGSPSASQSMCERSGSATPNHSRRVGGASPATPANLSALDWPPSRPAPAPSPCRPPRRHRRCHAVPPSLDATDAGSAIVPAGHT